MPCNYSTIGLSADSNEEIEALIDSVYQQSESILCENGSYRKWHANGAEVWLHIDGESEVRGMTPSFNGKSKVHVGITGLVEGDSNSQYEASMHCWAEPNTNGDNGTYPFIFDLVNKAQYPNLNFPLFTTASISAFAHQLEIFDDEVDFEKNQSHDIPFAAKSFIPVGLFMGEEQEIPPLAVATFAGNVLEYDRIINELSGNSFYWLLIETLGGTFDVVADPKLINKKLAVGKIVSGTFGLIGQIELSPTQMNVPKKEGFFRRLFSR